MVDPSSFQIRAKKIGDTIQEARLASGKGEEDCAAAMGLSTTKFQAFEKGEDAISLPELEILAYYLDIPVDHFLGRETISLAAKANAAVDKLETLLPLRHRIIGIILLKSRNEAAISLEELARATEIDEQKLAAYESGNTPVPLPELEVLTVALNVSLRNFRDQRGPVGRWAIQKKALEDFSELPLEMQQFISKPINLPYLELAQRLSEMSVDRLRGVAEGLLEITL